MIVCGRGGTGSDIGRGFLGVELPFSMSRGVVNVSRDWLVMLLSFSGLTGLLESSISPRPQESHVFTLFASIGEFVWVGVRFAETKPFRGERGVPKSIVVDRVWPGIEFFLGEVRRSIVVDLA